MAGRGWGAVAAATASNVVARVQLFRQALYYGSAGGGEGVGVGEGGAQGMSGDGDGVGVGVQVGFDRVVWEDSVGIAGSGGGVGREIQLQTLRKSSTLTALLD